MRWIVYLCFGVLALSPTVVSGETGNYLERAYNEAVEMMELYRSQAFYYSNSLSEEAARMGQNFTEQIAVAAARATTQAQGARIQSCAELIHDMSWSNMNYLSDYCLATGKASDRLHKTVWSQLTTMNLKEYDPELFYYYHSYLMDEAYNELVANYTYNMLTAFLNIYEDFDVNSAELEECLYNALNN